MSHDAVSPDPLTCPTCGVLLHETPGAFECPSCGFRIAYDAAERPQPTDAPPSIHGG